MNRLAKFVGTFFGLGFLPFAPGTFGAVGGLLISYLLLLFDFEYLEFQFLHLFFILIFYKAGVWACGKLKSEWGNDPSRVVIDEAIGFWVSILFLPMNFWIFLAGFILFRFFDILKPFGIKKLDQWHNAHAIMLDDVLAGIYSNVILQIMVYLNIIGVSWI